MSPIVDQTQISDTVWGLLEVPNLQTDAD